MEIRKPADRTRFAKRSDGKSFYWIGEVVKIISNCGALADQSLLVGSQSSDSTIPSAGTDVAYIGAHQAGFVRKPHPAAATHAPLRVKTDYPYGTVASPLERSAKAASQAPRDARAEHSAHRQAAAAAKAPTAQPAAPPAKAARAMPESSDATVPEMGTNVVFEGASAVSAALQDVVTLGS